MDFLNTLTDDEIALLGCAVAFVVSGTVMCLSYFVGRYFLTRGKRQIVLPLSPATHDLDNAKKHPSSSKAA